MTLADAETAVGEGGDTEKREQLDEDDDEEEEEEEDEDDEDDDDDDEDAKESFDEMSLMSGIDNTCRAMRGSLTGAQVYPSD